MSPSQAAEASTLPYFPPSPSRKVGRGDRFLILSLLAWFLAALLAALLYPARQVSDLVWALLPLWALAALEIAPIFARRSPSISWPMRQDPDWAAEPDSGSSNDSAISWGEAVLLFILLALFWLTLSGLNLNLPGLSGTGIRAAVLGGILLLGALAVGLVALGWSWPVARAGLYGGLLISLGVYLIGAMWGAAFTRQNAPQELWSLAPAPGQARLVEATLRQISTWRTGFPQDLDVVVTLDSQALRWSLRDFQGVRYLDTPPTGELPEIIITAAEGALPALTSAYRGQDFVWQAWPGWNDALPPEEARWLTQREAPLIQNSLILWARSDLFPGGSLEEPP